MSTTPPTDELLVWMSGDSAGDADALGDARDLQVDVDVDRLGDVDDERPCARTAQSPAARRGGRRCRPAAR